MNIYIQNPNLTSKDKRISFITLEKQIPRKEEHRRFSEGMPMSKVARCIVSASQCKLFFWLKKKYRKGFVTKERTLEYIL